MSRVELNRAEYAGTDLSEHIQRECELIDDYVEDIRATGTRVLEVGPGNGRTVAYLLQKGFSVEIIDRDAEVLEILRENLSKAAIDRSRMHTITIAIEDWDPPGNAYSFISISRVLHFLESASAFKVLGALSRSLVTGGLILVRVHADDHPDAQTALKNPNSGFKHFFKAPDFQQCEAMGFFEIHSLKRKFLLSRRQAFEAVEAEGLTDDAKRRQRLQYWMNYETRELEFIFRKI